MKVCGREECEIIRLDDNTIICEYGDTDCWFLKSMKKKYYKEHTMNKIIIELFPKTKDAVLIEKWFGAEIDNPKFQLLLKGKEKEVIAEAEKLEKESTKKS
jgi:hypothetical protein